VKATIRIGYGFFEIRWLRIEARTVNQCEIPRKSHGNRFRLSEASSLAGGGEGSVIAGRALNQLYWGELP